MKYSLFYSTLIIAAVAVSASDLFAEAPAGYYSSCEGKSGQTLLLSLHDVIGNHKNVGYDGLWNVYRTSDIYPDGTIWDMYSTKHWNPDNKCGNYSAVGDCYNREHSMPKSWFSDASPMVSDAFHIFPTDGRVNGQRSNFPYGECSGGTTLSSSGSVKALGRLGKSTYPGYTKTVFEPDDQYKGDFARAYFYMAACYNDRISTWDSDMLARNSFPVFQDWALGMLLKWHRQDPVSDKERNRNDAVYAYQNNRNPFVDYPELVEHIWGEKSTQGWISDTDPTPEFVYPFGNDNFDIGSTSINSPVSITLYVRGMNLTEDAVLTVSDSRFALSASTLGAAEVNSTDGARLTVTFTSSTKGTATAVVSINSGTASTSFSVTATAYDSLTALEPSVITDDGFVARWVNIDAPGTQYDLYVAFNATPLSGYPIHVDAASETCEITNLDSETTYTYWLESSTLQSNVVSVTTGSPIPMITFLFDGDLEFNTAPGVPSDVAEVLVDAQGISGDITVSVTSPFEVSTDRTNWGTSVVLVEGEDRFYLRVYSENVGQYTTVLKAVSGDYINDDAVVRAVVSDNSFIERFPSVNASYNETDYQGEACRWTFTDAGVFDQLDSDKNLPTGDNQSVRFGETSTSCIATAEDKQQGVGTISYYTRRFTNDNEAAFALEMSTDGGLTWTLVDNVSVSDGNWTLHSHDVNFAGDVRFRFRQTSGSRFNLGHIAISDYSISGLHQTLEYHNWDAYCLDGKLVVINAQNETNVKIFDMAGITHYNGRLGDRLELDLPSGIYVVLVDNFTRRVAVR